MHDVNFKKSLPELLGLYRRLRTSSMHLKTSLVKLIPGEALQAGGEALGLWQNGVLVFDNMDQSSVLMDYCLHTSRSNGKTVFEQYLEENPLDPQSDEFLILKALIGARFSLFRVEKLEPGFGAMTQDLLRGDRGFVMDVSLSESAVQHMVVACRMISPTSEFSMTTGAALPVDRDAAARIVPGLESKFLRSKRSLRDFTQEEMAELSAFIIRTLLAVGASDRIRYETISQPRPPGTGTTLRRERKPGRNAPCPCGSGKKYKNCCGA